MKSKVYILHKSFYIMIILALVLFCCVDSVTRSQPGLRVAMVQMDIVEGNLEENMQRAEKSIRGAAGK